MSVSELRVQLVSALPVHIADNLGSAKDALLLVALEEDALLLAALKKQVEANLEKFFAQLDIKTNVKKLMKRYEAEYSRMWKELVREYFPASRAEFDRCSKHVLIIGPGFGFKENPAQIKCLQQAGYQVRYNVFMRYAL
jgi:hypothetical protein